MIAPLQPLRRRTTTSAWLWVLLPLPLLVLFLLWPLVELTVAAFTPQVAGAASPVALALSGTMFWDRVLIGGAQALDAVTLSLVAGIPIAYVVSRVGLPGRALLRAIATVPLLLPSVVVALAFREVLGAGGWLNSALANAGIAPLALLGTPSATIAAHAAYGVAIVVALVAPAWTRIDARQIEAARMLGAGPLSAFTSVTLPGLMPALAASAALVFGFAFTSVGVVLILGSAPYDTLEVAIYRLSTEGATLSSAAAMACLQWKFTVAALLIARAMTHTSRRTFLAEGQRPALHAPRRSAVGQVWAALLALFSIIAALLLVAVPLAALVTGALTSNGLLSGAHFETIWRDAGNASRIPYLDSLLWSLLIAAGASAIATVAATATAFAIARARGRRTILLDAALWIPLGIPPVTLATGFILTFGGGRGGMADTAWGLLFAHALIAYPFVLWVVLPRLRAIDTRYAEAATLLGASPWRLWRRVELHMARRALLTGAVLAFLVSLGEFGASLMLARPGFTTAPVAIYEAFARGETGPALALASILMTVAMVAFLLIERLRFREACEC